MSDSDEIRYMTNYEKCLASHLTISAIRKIIYQTENDRIVEIIRQLFFLYSAIDFLIEI